MRIKQGPVTAPQDPEFLFSRFPIRKDEKWFLESLTVTRMEKRAIDSYTVRPRFFAIFRLKISSKMG
jgi:hypothetical protein